MKLATQHLNDMPSAPLSSLSSMSPLSRLPAAGSAPRVDGQSSNDWLELTLVMLIAFASLLAFSLLLPDGPARVVQEVLGWCMAGSVLGLGLLAAIKGLNGLLDS